jgi:hypothetical protein
MVWCERSKNAPLAQLVERGSNKAKVVGSNPARSKQLASG